MKIDFSQVFSEEEFSDTFKRCPSCANTMPGGAASHPDVEDWGGTNVYALNCRKCNYRIQYTGEEYGCISATWNVGTRVIIADYRGMKLYTKGWENTYNAKPLIKGTIVDFEQIHYLIDKYRILA